MKIEKNTPLRLAPDVQVQLISQNSLNVTKGEKVIHGTKVTLDVINTFYFQKTFDEGVKLLGEQAASPNHWVKVVNEIRRLYQFQILLAPNQEEPSIGNHSGSFESAPVHIRMLNDEQRTTKYQEAIRELVTPEDIVLDIGTGTGVLAITAAKAGAKHVYAVERSSIGKQAQIAFERNGVADKITLIDGDSKEITLPEKATILVSEIIGNDPLQENILVTTKDAVKRHLTPDAKLIPSHLSLKALALNIPSSYRSNHFFNEKMIHDWKEKYGIDFDSLLEADENREPSKTNLKSLKIKDWKTLSEPILVKEIDLSKIESNNVESEQDFEILQAGEFNGLFLYFDAQLSTNTTLSMHPNEVDKNSHWAGVLWMPSKGWDVKPKDVFKLEYKYIKESEFVIQKHL